MSSSADGFHVHFACAGELRRDWIHGRKDIEKNGSGKAPCRGESSDLRRLRRLRGGMPKRGNPCMAGQFFCRGGFPVRRLRTLRQGMPGLGHRNRGESMKTHWYHYLWIWSLLYFSLGFFNILFAWLELISFFLPLVFAIGFGNKHFCNRYCDRGQLFRMLGSQRGFSRNRDMPGWMKSSAFRYGFLLFFLAMFANVLYATYLVAGGARDVQEVVTLFWTFGVPWEWAVSATASPWAVQFAYGFYSPRLFWASSRCFSTSRAPGACIAPWAP